MKDSAKLAERVGTIQYQQMLKRANPRDEEQWAWAVLHSMEQQDSLRLQTRRTAREEMSRLSQQHFPMGPEEEEQLQAWAATLPSTKKRHYEH